MEAYLPPEAKQASDLFRERYCYSQQVDDVLMAHMTTIRSLYDSYSTANDHRAASNSARLLSVGEWQRLMKVACDPRAEELSTGRGRGCRGACCGPVRACGRGGVRGGGG